MRLLPLILTAGILAASPAAARDPFDADWGGDCRPDVICYIKIRPAKKGTYRLEYVARSQRDPRKVVCRSTGLLRRSVVVLGALSGTFGPKQRQRIDVVRGGDGDRLHVIPTDNAPCGKPLAVGGRYDLLAH